MSAKSGVFSTTVACAGAKGVACRAAAAVLGDILGNWTRPEISTSSLLSIRSVFLSILKAAYSFVLNVELCLEIHSVSGRLIICYIFLLFGFFFGELFAGVILAAEIFPSLSVPTLADGINPGETLQTFHRFNDIVIIVRHLPIPLT
jgi:hypothetical protein